MEERGPALLGFQPGQSSGLTVEESQVTTAMISDKLLIIRPRSSDSTVHKGKHQRLWNATAAYLES